MQILIPLLAWVAATIVLAPVCFFAVIFLAGPHSSILPNGVQSFVLLLGWAVFLLAPIVIARTVSRRSRKEHVD